MIPKKVILIGKNYEESKKEFSQKLNIVQGPALRFEYMYKNIESRKRQNSILVAFSAVESENNNIWNMISKSKVLKNKKILIKKHPIINTEVFFSNKVIPKNFIFTNLSFENLIKKSRVIITGGSTSTIIESIANGVPVLIPYNNEFDKLSLETVKINKNFYKICHDRKQFEQNILFLSNKHQLISNDQILYIRKNYFNINSDIIDLTKIL